MAVEYLRSLGLAVRRPRTSRPAILNPDVRGLPPVSIFHCPWSSCPRPVARNRLAERSRIAALTTEEFLVDRT
jgi:hypothetical protein